MLGEFILALVQVLVRGLHVPEVEGQSLPSQKPLGPVEIVEADVAQRRVAQLVLERAFGFSRLVEGELKGVGMESLQLAAHVGMKAGGGLLRLVRSTDIVSLQEINDL